MNLILSELEEKVLTELAERNGTSKTGILRSALRLYQLIDARIHAGETMAFVDANGQVIKQEILGCGH